MSRALLWKAKALELGPLLVCWTWWKSRVLNSWQQKGSFILIFPLIVALQAQIPVVVFLYHFIWALITLLGLITLGYLSHDLSDLGEDRAANKVNLWQEHKIEGLCLLLLISWPALAPWYILPKQAYSYLLLGLELLCIVLYALPPFRLKSHPYLSVALDAIYAYSIPSVLAAYTFYLVSGSRVDLVLMILWGGWATLVGIRHYLNHLCLDLVHDRQSGRSTLPMKYGVSQIRSFMSEGLLVAEISLIGSSLIYTFASHSLALQLIGLAIIAFVVYRSCRSNQYRFTHIFVDNFYRYELPLGILLLCTLQEARYIWVLAIYYVLFYKISFSHPVFQSLRGPLSTCVNYSIYYFRRHALRQDEKQARRDQYPAYLRQVQQIEQVKQEGAIAVINQHHQKYTETFIWEEIESLPFGVYYLHGGLLPCYEGEGRPLLSQYDWHQRAWSLWAELRSKPSDYYLEQAICRFLINKKVKALLVHFGPSASRLLPVSRATGIPLLAYFHGYDIHHKNIQSQYAHSYRELFKGASALLCASDDIRHRLAQLGAAEKKLHTLPAYVNLSLFPYVDHSRRPASLLFVGRFCETKSPHLLLIAFAELLKVLPQARLTLVGKNGGGELFEACHILAKALDIDSSLRFLGERTHQEVAYEMQHARALVLPSLTTPIHGDREGTPVAVMEACAAGLPVISTSHAGIAELITSEENGILVPEYDILALTRAMLRICTNNALAHRIGLRAARRIRKDDRISSHSEQLSKYILQAIKDT